MTAEDVFVVPRRVALAVRNGARAKTAPAEPLAGFVESGADFFYMRPVGANGFVELVAGYAKFFGPVGDV